jgi:hypothetical protein
MINSNDGGANVSVNAGATWTGQEYPTAQMYDVRVTNHFPYHICGGQQDNSTACVPMDGDGILLLRVGVRDGPGDPASRGHDLFYGACYGGSMSFMSRITGQSRAINVWPVNPMGNSAGDLRERFQWNPRSRPRPTIPGEGLRGSQHVWRVQQRGQSWTRISDDLTYADPETLGPSGGDITRDQTSVEYYATVWRSRSRPTSRASCGWARTTGRSTSPATAGGAGPTSRRRTCRSSAASTRSTCRPTPRPRRTSPRCGTGCQDVAPYVYRTEDYGRSWTKIVDGVPEGHYVRTVREDLKRPGLLYAGTEHGVLVSFDDGGHWQSLQLNLPAVQVPGLVAEGTTTW